MSRHFRKRLYTVCHEPYRSGSSLHGAPPLAIHSIPFIALQLSHFAGRPRFPCFGCSGGSISLIRFHSLSVSSYRFVPMEIVYINLSFCATFIFQTRPNYLSKNFKFRQVFVDLSNHVRYNKDVETLRRSPQIHWPYDLGLAIPTQNEPSGCDRRLTFSWTPSRPRLQKRVQRYCRCFQESSKRSCINPLPRKFPARLRYIVSLLPAGCGIGLVAVFFVTVYFYGQRVSTSGHDYTTFIESCQILTK